jgi:hypothetical protein
MAEQSIVPGSRYDSANPVLLNLQAPTGVPRSSRLASVSDPLGATPPLGSRLDHFWPGLYDLSPESHLSRLLNAILGDAGIGAVSKQFTVSRLQSMVMTTRYLDLDRLYGGLLGMRRMAVENLGMDPYVDGATPAEWEVIDAKDAAYRSRVEAFSRALSMGPTPDGMAALAQAVTGVECVVHESYLDADDTAGPGDNPAPPGGRTYGEVETSFIYYGFMRNTYADIEAKVAPLKAVENAYSRTSGAGVPTAQARPAFSSYQGEDWYFNGDVASVVSYTMVNGEIMDRYDYQRVTTGSVSKDYTPNLALTDQQAINAGRVMASGALATSPFTPDRGVPVK